MDIAIRTYERVASGVLKIVVYFDGQPISSATGFLVGGLVVTCGHVYRGMPESSIVEFRFQRSTLPLQDIFRIEKRVIDAAVMALSDEHAFDYCVLKLPIDVNGRHQFVFSSDPISVGQTVFSLGYPFNQQHLSIHNGIVSASYRSSVAEILQLQMSINPANSGGPLLQTDGRVCGVICRKATGLSDMFEELIKSFHQNQQLLQNATRGGSVQLMGVDPIKLGLAIQSQMERIAQEIKRSANVGIGYAISCKELSEESCFQADPGFRAS